MKKYLTFIALIFSIGLFSQAKQPNNSIKDFVDFLKQDNLLSPKEYIFDLYMENDIVILTERHHADITQYELIIDVLKDERFNGNLYTEIGTVHLIKAINNFLKKENLTENKKKEEILKIERNLIYHFVWEKYNYYHLLSSIYDINQTRKGNKKIMLYPLDVKYDWESIKYYEEYKMFVDLQRENIIDRDLVMGVNFVNTYQKVIKNNPNKNKALVILNIYHGYTKIPVYAPLPTEPFNYSTAEYIYKTYPKTTKNIYLNSVIYDPKYSLVEDGKWDAAFKYTGNKNVGFNMKDTPFGQTEFNMYYFGGGFEKVNFEYIFDGFIFYYPFDEFNLAWGIPDIYSDEFTDLFYRRISITDGITVEEAKNSQEIKDFLKEINTLQYSKVEDLNMLLTQMNKWLDNN
jgi:hypothetical protein